MHNNFSQEQIDKIKRLYNDGVDVDAIVDEFSCEEHNIRKILKYYRLDRGYRIWSDELTEKVLLDYEQRQMPVKDIVYKYLISESGLIKVAKRNNIYVPKREKYSKDVHYFDEINTPNKAYILGLLYADGCNNVKNYTIQLWLQEQDKSLLEVIKDELKYEGPLRYKIYDSPNCKNQFGLNIANKYLSISLEKLGMVQNKSNILTFPKFLQPDLVPHFIRGIFDGDGCMSWNINRKTWYVSIVGTYDICCGIGNYMDSIGCKYCIRQDKRCVNCFQIEPTSISSRFYFLESIYNDAEIKMDRKYEKFLSLCEEFNMKISSSQRVDE